MGTNYYWHNSKPCVTCGHDPNEPKHIGKSSMGWCFSLHVYPDESIRDIDDWELLWATPGTWIEDEYGRRLTADDMRLVILARAGKPDWDSKPFGYSSWNEFHSDNFSQRGPAGLLRHKVVAGHCIGHGSGTWDLLIGSFS